MKDEKEGKFPIPGPQELIEKLFGFLRAQPSQVTREDFLSHLLQKGWLDANEVVAMMNNIEQERVSGWRVIYTYEGPGFHPLKSTYGRVEVARPLRMPLNKYIEEVKV